MKRIALLILLIAAWMLSSCTSDKPLPSGFENLQRTYKGELKVLELAPTASGGYWEEPVAGSLPTLLLGKHGNAQSFALIQLTNYTSFDTANVQSAKVHLRQSGRYGSGAGFTVVAHPVQSTWTEDTVVWSTVKDQYDKNTAITSFTVPNADTGWVSFDLPAATVNNWMTTTSSNYGLLLDFADASFMAEFVSSDASSYLGYANVVYKTKAGVLDTLTTYVSYDASLLQNLTATPEKTLEREPDRLHINNATGYRGLLRFDLSAIPKNATIHQALLSMYVDKTGSDTDSSGIAIYADAVVNDSTWNPTSIALDTLSTYPQAYAYEDVEKVEFSTSSTIAAMSAVTQNWVLGNPPNYGLVLYGSSGLDGQWVSLYSGKDQPAYKPVLKITYSLPPSSRF
jgi:hypothetical protein